MDKVTIIIVNWNGCEDTIQCLESLESVTYKDYDVVIVDNGSGDGSEDRIRGRFHEHTVLQSGSNIGFAGGVNIGLRHALKENADYMLLLNNDTEVTGDFLDKLVDRARSDEKTGIVGGKTYQYDDKKTLSAYGSIFNVNSGRARHFFGEEEDAVSLKSPEFLFIQGCLMLIKKECYEDIGGLSEKFFHLGEDVEYCVRAQKRGWKLGLASESIVYHKSSASMKHLSPIYNYYDQRNRLYIVKEYNNFKNIFDSIVNMGINVLRILHAIFFRTDRTHFLDNFGNILSGVRDFMNGKSGKRP